MEGKENKKDFLLIKFEELIKNTEEIVISIFEFFKIEYNKKLLNKSIDLNKIENHKKYMNDQIDETIRFSNLKDNNNKEFILKKLNNQIQTSLY